MVMRNGRSRFVPLLVCWIQGIYFTATGLWPLVNMNSFEIVTGPKTDHWLVSTVALLIVAIGLTLLVAAWRKQIDAEIIILGIASALALSAIDVIYVMRQTIAPVYLLDMMIELILATGWIYCTIASINKLPLK